MNACTPHPPLVIFDGVCALCNRVVRFCASNDRSMTLRFVARESEAGRELLARFAIPREADTIVLIEAGRAFTRSDAALGIAAHLRPPWRWLRALRVVPRVLRDPFYRLIARGRFRIFARLEACPAPPPSLRDRVIEHARDLPEGLLPL